MSSKPRDDASCNGVEEWRVVLARIFGSAPCSSSNRTISTAFPFVGWYQLTTLHNVRSIRPNKLMRHSPKERHQFLRKLQSRAKIPRRYEHNTSEEAPRLTPAHVLRLTRLTPPEAAAENALITLTVGPNHFVNRSSPLRDLSNSRT